MGGRAQLRLADPISSPRPRLRTPPRCLRGHDLPRHGRLARQKNLPSVTFSNGLLAVGAALAIGAVLYLIFAPESPPTMSDAEVAQQAAAAGMAPQEYKSILYQLPHIHSACKA